MTRIQKLIDVALALRLSDHYRNETSRQIAERAQALLRDCESETAAMNQRLGRLADSGEGYGELDDYTAALVAIGRANVQYQEHPSNARVAEIHTAVVRAMALKHTPHDTASDPRD